MRFIRPDLEVEGKLFLTACVGRVEFDSNELRLKCRGLTGDVGQIVTGVA